jgi:hypothetical protein
MRDFTAWSVQNITALTTAKAAMKVQSTNTQDTEFLHLAQGKLIRKSVVPSCKLIKVYALQEAGRLG